MTNTRTWRTAGRPQRERSRQITKNDSHDNRNKSDGIKAQHAYAYAWSLSPNKSAFNLLSPREFGKRRDSVNNGEVEHGLVRLWNDVVGRTGHSARSQDGEVVPSTLTHSLPICSGIARIGLIGWLSRSVTVIRLAVAGGLANGITLTKLIVAFGA